MRGVLEQVVVLGLLALANLFDFLADRDEGFDQSVNLLKRFRLGDLDQQTGGNGPRAGRRVEAIVDQSLGKVHHLESDILEFGNVNQKLVSHTATVTGVLELVVILQTVGDVIGCEQRSLGRLLETSPSKHLDVSPCNGQDRSGTPRSGRDGVDSHLASCRCERVTREEWSEMLGDTDRANTRSSTTVRDREGLVQVQVGDIGTHDGRVGEGNLSLQVGTVQVHLTSVVVNNLEGFLDVLEVATSGSGLGDHGSSELVLVELSLGSQILQIDRTINLGLDGTTRIPAIIAEAGLVP